MYRHIYIYILLLLLLLWVVSHSTSGRKPIVASGRKRVAPRSVAQATASDRKQAVASVATSDRKPILQASAGEEIGPGRGGKLNAGLKSA